MQFQNTSMADLKDCGQQMKHKRGKIATTIGNTKHTHPWPIQPANAFRRRRELMGWSTHIEIQWRPPFLIAARGQLLKDGRHAIEIKTMNGNREMTGVHHPPLTL